MIRIYEGFRFGMLLQLAVGPISLLIFKIAGSNGFSVAMVGTSAVVLVDSLFILLAILGIASFVGKERTRKVFTAVGAVIMGLFGAATILGVFGINPIPEIHFSGSLDNAGPFMEAFILTAANPLTILFWAGVFSTRITTGKLTGIGVYLFGLGCALSTLAALTVVGIIGTLTGTFLPEIVISILNFIIGVVLILFAFRMIVPGNKKGTEAGASSADISRNADMDRGIIGTADIEKDTGEMQVEQ